MKKGHYVVKTVPATTNNITKAIVNFLDSKGHKAMRVNTEGQYDERLGMWRNSGSTEGVSDVLCCLAPAGIFLAIEVKIGKDRMKKSQVKFFQDIAAAGGLTFKATGYNEFLEFYNTEIEPLISKTTI